MTPTQKVIARKQRQWLTPIKAGDVFGLWVVVCESERRGRVGQLYWVCKCGCGAVKDVADGSLKAGISGCCGCVRNKKVALSKTKHGLHKTPEYQSWVMMKSRCDNPNVGCYKYYGGRGVTYCDSWSSFENFIKDMGSKPSLLHTIDRIDPFGNYEPSNCRWATRLEQARNQRRHHKSTCILKACGKWEE